MLLCPEDTITELYKSLGSTNQSTFRLLQIYPVSGTTTNIKIRLFNASLDDPPPYDALSYRWESSTRKQCILVNGARFLVSSNLYSAMLRMQSQSAPMTGTYWIDQICINQTSTMDRNQQVQLMGLIYSKAQVVRIWLGSESDNAEKAFSLVGKCALSPDHRDTVEMVMSDEAGARALTKLLHRTYWNRMWVFQEIVLARKAVVHCGQQEAPWSHFSRLDEISADHKLWLTAQSQQSWILQLRKALFKIAQFCIHPKEAQHIDNALYPTRHLQCQDPRDKLYALRGVCKSLANKMAPDYSAPVWDVYTLFAKAQIRQDEDLTLLLTAGLWDPSNGEDIQLPTWVPDFRGMDGVDIRFLAGKFLKCFGADDTIGIDVRFQDCDGYSILNAQAMLIDSVHTYQKLDSSINDDEKRKRLILDYCLAEDGKSLSMAKLRHYFQAMIFENSTFFGHGTNTGSAAKERMQNLVLGFLEELQQFFGQQPVFARFVKSFIGLDIDLADIREMEVIDPDRLYVCRLEYLCRTRETTDKRVSAIYTTVHGRMGIGSRRLDQGDHIAIVQGCRVPLLLRRCGPYYNLVGSSYVSGLMDKEGVSLAVKDLQGKVIFEPIQLV